MSRFFILNDTSLKGYESDTPQVISDAKPLTDITMDLVDKCMYTDNV